MWNFLKRFFTSSSPRKVIEAVIKRGIGFYDYDKLDGDQKLVYYNQIQMALKNEALANEVNYLMSDWVQEIAKSDKDYNKDKILRYSLNALQVLMERLEEIPDPRKKEPTQDNLNDVI